MDWNKVAAAVTSFFEDVKDAAETGAEKAKETAGDAADTASDAAKTVAAETRRGVTQVAAEVERGVERIRDTVTKGLEAIADGTPVTGTDAGYAVPLPPPPDPYKERLLTDDEKNLARGVFGSTLPYGAIWLSNGLGLGQRPYTIPHPLHLGSYVVHFGPAGFDDATDSSVMILGMKADAVLVHELTHVWQGTNRRNPFDYIVDSLYNQFRFGAGAYDYELTDGATWSDFSAEQQAHIVEDWYSNGSAESDARFPFIRDNVRTGAA